MAGNAKKQYVCDHEIPVAYEYPGSSAPFPSYEKVYLVLEGDEMFIEDQSWVCAVQQTKHQYHMLLYEQTYRPVTA